MMMILPDGSRIERPAFYDKPQGQWTEEEIKLAVALQEMHYQEPERPAPLNEVSRAT
jgi:hypothetical protein